MHTGTVSAVVPQLPRLAYLDIRKGHPEFRVVRLAQEEVPEPKFLRLLLEFDESRTDTLPARRGVRGDVRVHDTGRRPHIVLFARVHARRSMD